MSIIEVPEQATGELSIDEAVSKNPDARYEIVNGQYVEMPPMSTSAGVIASRLLIALGAFVMGRDLGEVVYDVLFPVKPAGKTRRRPDGAFVSYQRWPKGRPLPHTDPWPVVPELVVEVVSPTDPAEDLRGKVTEYVEAGVLLVWVIYPKLRLVDAYQSPSNVRVYTEADVLDGGEVLKEFHLPLKTLFENFTENGTPPA
jgi:Uma2 family endonuclease